MFCSLSWKIVVGFQLELMTNVATHFDLIYRVRYRFHPVLWTLVHSKKNGGLIL